MDRKLTEKELRVIEDEYLDRLQGMDYIVQAGIIEARREARAEASGNKGFSTVSYILFAAVLVWLALTLMGVI